MCACAPVFKAKSVKLKITERATIITLVISALVLVYHSRDYITCFIIPCFLLHPGNTIAGYIILDL